MGFDNRNIKWGGGGGGGGGAPTPPPPPSNAYKRNMYWKGSTANSINSLDFNQEANWMEYRYNFKDNKWYWLSNVVTPSGFNNGDATGISAGARMIGAPSAGDYVHIGLAYPAPTNTTSATRYFPLAPFNNSSMTGNIAAGTYPTSSGPGYVGVGGIYYAPYSPCLFGGYSGGISGGVNCWRNGNTPTGLTFTSALTEISMAWDVSANNIGSTGAVPAMVYPYKYLGTGLTAQTLAWLQTGSATNNTSWPKGWTGTSVVTEYSQKPLVTKSRTIYAASPGVAGSVTKFTSFKNWTPYNVGTTANYGAYTLLNLRTRQNSSGSIAIGGYASTVNHTHLQTTTVHNQCSTVLSFSGATLGNVKTQGSPITYYDRTCVVSDIKVCTGYYHGPLHFSGRLDTTGVRNDLYAGSAGVTGAPSANYDSSIATYPLTNWFGQSIRSLYTVDYNQVTNQVFDLMRPTVYFSDSTMGSTPCVANGLYMSSSMGDPLSRSRHGNLADSSRWCLKFGGEAAVNTVYLSNAGCVISGNRIGGDPIPYVPAATQSVRVGTCVMSNASELGYGYNNRFSNFYIGTSTCGAFMPFTSGTQASLGVVADDDSSSITPCANLQIKSSYINNSSADNGGGAYIPATKMGGEQLFLLTNDIPPTSSEL